MVRTKNMDYYYLSNKFSFYGKYSKEERELFNTVYCIISTLTLEDEYLQLFLDNSNKNPLVYITEIFIVLLDSYERWINEFYGIEDEIKYLHSRIDGATQIYHLICDGKIKNIDDLCNSKEYDTMRKGAKDCLNLLGLRIEVPDKLNIDDWVDWYEYQHLAKTLKIKLY